MNQHKDAYSEINQQIQQHSMVHRQLQDKILPLKQRCKNIQNIIKTKHLR